MIALPFLALIAGVLIGAAGGDCTCHYECRCSYIEED